MSRLRLRIDKYLDSDGGPPPEAIATIKPIDPQSGIDMPSTPRYASIPITDQDQHAGVVDVADGRYRVEVVLPTGEILFDNVQVSAGQDANVVLKGQSSPHEWLGWQFLMGNVTTLRVPPIAKFKEAPKSKARALSARKPSGKSVKRAPSKDSSAELSSMTATVLGSSKSASPPAATAAAAPATKATNPLLWLSNPSHLLSGGGWLELAKLADAPTEALSKLNSGKPAREVPCAVNDERRAMFRVTHGTGGTSGTIGLQSTLARDFIVLKLESAVELLSLPTPWPVLRSGREATIEIVVQPISRAGEFASSVAVRDERLALLLGYLSSGGFSTATQITEGAKDLLFGKIENHLAATAGAYAMLGSETDTQKKDWHQWIKNLMEWYPAMPDGAIQWATLLMRQGPSQHTEACAAFKTACKRGLPYYSLGLRWLLEGLERYGGRDTEAADMARAVRGIASRMHQQSPFTIIRLGGR